MAQMNYTTDLNSMFNSRVKLRVLLNSLFKLQSPAMNLQEYFSEEPLGAKVEMARHLGISAEWMSKLISRKAKPSPLLSRKIEEATQGLVTRKDLRPDLFL